MSKKFFIRIVFGLLLTLSANAATCSKSYTLGFFNGVWNTEYESFDGTQAVRGLIGNTYNNEPVKYESFYNHTGSSVGATSLQDLAETFIQRANEIDKSGQMGKRFEYFWEFLGSSEPTFLDKLAGFLPNAASLFDSVYTAITTKLTSIISFFLSNPPTEADYTSHNARLDALATDGEKLMLVGHSQGNLFMNHAYDHILPVVTKDRVAAAHIAPASPTLRGNWVLADIDLVINALRIQGVTSVPNINLTIPASKVDVSGHTLSGTYLDPTRDGRGRVKTMIETGMGKLKNSCGHLEYRIIITDHDTIGGEVYHNIGSYLTIPSRDEVITALGYQDWTPVDWDASYVLQYHYDAVTSKSGYYLITNYDALVSASYLKENLPHGPLDGNWYFTEISKLYYYRVIRYVY
ncbi:MAG: hypothetical protein Q8R58_01575 [Sulfuricurvum sp.]|nr:hypothetical protein [Sulfuricurvum sp.]